MAENKEVAEIHYTTETRIPTIELIVPHGTRLADVVRSLETVSSEIISRISPRGCQTCTSGTHLVIRERFENVVRVNLADGRIIG